MAETIFELPLHSVSKRVLEHNPSYGNDFYLHFRRKVVHQDSFWCRGKRQLENDLLKRFNDNASIRRCLPFIRFQLMATAVLSYTSFVAWLSRRSRRSSPRKFYGHSRNIEDCNRLNFIWDAWYKWRYSFSTNLPIHVFHNVLLYPLSHYFSFSKKHNTSHKILLNCVPRPHEKAPDIKNTFWQVSVTFLWLQFDFQS